MILSPKQRRQALLAGKPIDRSAVVLFDNLFAAKFAGMSYAESEATAANIAHKEIAVFKAFGHDDVTIIFGNRGLAVPLGAQTKGGLAAPPAIITHPLTDINDLCVLNPRLAAFENDQNQQKLYQAMTMIAQEIGDEAETRFCLCAPFTAASGLFGLEQLLRATRKDKAAVHQLLEFTTKLLLAVIDKFAEIDNIIFHLADPVASGSLISPKQYREFAQPYTQRLAERIHQHNKRVTLHICGDTTQMFEMIADTGIDCFSVDQQVDLLMAKAKIGKRVTLLGNVDPVRVLLQGTPSSIDTAVRQCFEKAADSPCGFIIGPGCDVPYATPAENIAAYMHSARKYAALAAENKLQMP